MASISPVDQELLAATGCVAVIFDREALEEFCAFLNDQDIRDSDGFIFVLEAEYTGPGEALLKTTRYSDSETEKILREKYAGVDSNDPQPDA